MSGKENFNSPLGFFGKYLSLWVLIAIISGVWLGKITPNLFEAIASFEYAKVNIIIAVLIWAMIFPMMVQVDFLSISNFKNQIKGSAITLLVNWLIKPFSMALLGTLFFEYIFASFFTIEEAKQYIAGVIILGVAPCTAMVFVWSKLVKGNSVFTIVQVSLNDLIMIIAFVPITSFLLGINDIMIPWSTLLISVFLFIVVPLFFGIITRKFVIKTQDQLLYFSKKTEKYSIIGLILTIVILFALQANVILEKPFTILLISIPLLMQTYLIFFIAVLMGYFWKVPYSITAPAALIGTSNFFELAVAVAISLFGLHSGAALATVVGVLVEVPVMLSLVWICKKYLSKIL